MLPAVFNVLLCLLSAVMSAPGTSANAMSILDTISSLNQDASTRAGGEKGQEGELDLDDAVLNGSTGEQDMSLVEDEEE